MSEEIYKQQRRPITSQEITGEEAEKLSKTPAETMARAHEIHRELGHDIPKDDSIIKGNIPPQVQEALEKRKGAKAGSPLFNVSTNNPELEEIFARLKEKTGRYEEINLPSMGRFYNGSDGPTDGKVNIRPMTGNEEMILATPRFLKKGIALDMIFKECIKEPIQPTKLLTIDRTFILIYLRGISYGPDYEVEVRCPECSSSFTTNIDLNLPVEECPDEFNESSLEDKFPKSELRFRYRLSTGADEQAVSEHQEKRIKTFGEAATDDTILYRMALLTESIEHVKGIRLVQAVLQRLPIEDINYLRNLIIEPPFGPNTKVGIYCPSCSNDFQVNLPLEADFFFPRRKKEGKKVEV